MTSTAPSTTEWTVNGLHHITQPAQLTHCVNSTSLTRLISQWRLTELIRDGQIFRYQNQPVVLWPAVDADQTGDGIYIVWLSDALLPGNSQHHQLCEALFAGGADWINARFTAKQYGLVESSYSAKVRTTYLVSVAGPPLSTIDPHRTTGITVRPPHSPTERRFVADLLREAIRISLAGGAPAGLDPLTDRLAQQLVNETNLTLAGTPFQSVIALDGDKPLGQASWITHQRDELTGQQYVDLIDISVAPGLEGRGLAHLLSGPPIQAAHTAGIPLIGNVVSQPGGRHTAILDNLLRSGAWEISHVVVDVPRN